eukprot:TRINITY_DN7991_c1_g1_i2.p1 TRINITY_DN7991_c1_g1~~TRINITY_DN7991_c1_g1_i2.p1  ORF type:complete len:200 (+),score=19.03 TRINITY_DN7991_c1_g1_i2:36-602(+)
MVSSLPLIVEELEDASLIERRLRHAVSVCSAHRVSSNGDAQVLLGDFSLQNAKSGTTFRFGGEDTPPTIAGLPPGVLEIRLFLDGGALLSCARYTVEHDGKLEPYHQAAGVQLTLNVSSAESKTFLSYRGIPLILNGRWRASRSGCYSHRSASGSRSALLCVLSLLEGEPPQGRPSMMNALNLQSSRR